MNTPAKPAPFIRRTFACTLVLACCGALPGPACATQAQAGKDNEKLITLAREEAKKGKFMIMVSSPKSEAAHRKIMETFQKRFNIKADWEWTPLTSTVSAPRVHQQATAGLPVPSGAVSISVCEAVGELVSGC
ncbi:hypothetical protein [Xylophilus sp.]|uniref:hypothetical protein n=1 Tax=Xylophilus sp. TaxID=2653893 RepID=UPI0013BA4561|nr:hypothetical protein [Xylophilus sp.]KAF1042058.1 MAG: hypothetical protein GAK38_04431 [Xylophilus sp.]